MPALKKSFKGDSLGKFEIDLEQPLHKVDNGLLPLTARLENSPLALGLPQLQIAAELVQLTSVL